MSFFLHTLIEICVRSTVVLILETISNAIRMLLQCYYNYTLSKPLLSWSSLCVCTTVTYRVLNAVQCLTVHACLWSAQWAVVWAHENIKSSQTLCISSFSPVLRPVRAGFHRLGEEEHLNACSRRRLHPLRWRTHAHITYCTVQHALPIINSHALLKWSIQNAAFLNFSML